MIPLRKKSMLYLRNGETVLAGKERFELIKWSPPKHDEIINGKEYQSKIVITHVGSVAYDNTFYEIQYGDIWNFDFQLGTVNTPLQLPIGLEVESEEIVVLVDNLDTSDHIAELTIMGTYEGYQFAQIDKKKPVVYRERFS